MFKFNQTHMEQVITSIKNTKKDVTAVKNKVNGIKSDDVMINVDIRAAYTKLTEVESQIDNVGIWMENQKNSVLDAEAKNNALINSIFQVGSPWLYGLSERGGQKAMEEAVMRTNSALPQARTDLLMDTCAKLTDDLIAREGHYTVTYSLLTHHNIVKCSDDTNVKYFCCASYTTTALYRSGELEAGQINPFNYQGTRVSDGVPAMLAAAGWREVERSEMRAGDVVNKNDVHVLISAGEGRYWDNTSALINEEKGLHPTRTTRTYDNSICHIWRSPEQTVYELTDRHWELLKPYFPEEDVKLVDKAREINKASLNEIPEGNTSGYEESQKSIEATKVKLQNEIKEEAANTNGNKTNKENIKKVTLD